MVTKCPPERLSACRAATAITMKRRVELHPRSRGFAIGLSAPQTDRYRMAERWRSRTSSLKWATCRCSSLTTARRVAGGGGAWCTGSRVEAEKSGARGEGSCRLNNTVAKGCGARSADCQRRRSDAQSAGYRALAKTCGARLAGSHRRQSGA